MRPLWVCHSEIGDFSKNGFKTSMRDLAYFECLVSIPWCLIGKAGCVSRRSLLKRMDGDGSRTIYRKLKNVLSMDAGVNGRQ